MGGNRGSEELPFTDGRGGICFIRGEKAAGAGCSLKTKKPQRGNAEASGVTTLQEITV